MNRLIKFKGKDKNTKQWAFGILDFNTGMINWEEEKDGKIFYPSSSDIINDTISQFSGILDTNNKEIYENDIVEFFRLELVYQQTGNYPPPNIEVEEYDINRKIGLIEYDYGSFTIDGYPLILEDSIWNYETDIDCDLYKKQFEKMWNNNWNNICNEYPYLTWKHFNKFHIMGNKFDNQEVLYND